MINTHRQEGRDLPLNNISRAHSRTLLYSRSFPSLSADRHLASRGGLERKCRAQCSSPVRSYRRSSPAANISLDTCATASTYKCTSDATHTITEQRQKRRPISTQLARTAPLVTVR